MNGPCNPLIITPDADLDSKYEVWCRACGSQYADTLGEAQLLRDHHQPPAPKTWVPTEESVDWSEHPLDGPLLKRTE